MNVNSEDNSAEVSLASNKRFLEAYALAVKIRSMLLTEAVDKSITDIVLAIALNESSPNDPRAKWLRKQKSRLCK